ncbi:MAG TPA: glycosyltransferase family 2 protein [Patescibacteria group bacterium]
MQPALSIILPCLNEEAAIANCIQKAKTATKKLKLPTEIIVVDNGSKDNSAKIAKKLGAKVIFEKKRGYGNAYKTGFKNAKGRFILMADSDDTYDLSKIEKFIGPLKNGFDFVTGYRLENLQPQSLSSARKFGVIFLTGFLNLLFGTNFKDGHCGMRSFTQNAYKKMSFKTEGMEFASEMLIEAKRKNLKISQIPIKYYSRQKTTSKLNVIEDGLRHVIYLLTARFQK